MTASTPCDCEHGWVNVHPDYADRSVPLPTPPRVDATPDQVDRYGEAVALIDARRRMARNTVYPCKTCQPGLFFRWVGGHLDAKHDRSECDECSDGKRSRPRHSEGYQPAERRDTF